MSQRQRSKADALLPFLNGGEFKFLLALADYANNDGGGAFPRRKTLVTETGLSRRYLQVLEQRFVQRGWLDARVIGTGTARRTFYTLRLPDPRQLPLEFEPVQNPTNAADAVWKSGDQMRSPDPIESDPQISFDAPHSAATRTSAVISGIGSISDPKNLDPKNVQKKERPPLARRHSSLSALDLGRLHVAKAHLKARFEAARKRQRIVKLRRSR